MCGSAAEDNDTYVSFYHFQSYLLLAPKLYKVSFRKMISSWKLVETVKKIQI